MKLRVPVFILGLLCYVGQISAQADTPPNIIFLLLDDLNDYTETLGGHPQIETPNITHLEELGANFISAYSSAPKCSPSRTSMLTGKDLKYTDQYLNVGCRPFRDYFTEAHNNEEMVTLPEHFKDVGGYFTYGINKVYHCFDSDVDFDSAHVLPCEKELSWNKFSMFIEGEDFTIQDIALATNDGMPEMSWTPISDTLEPYMYDYRAVDSATLFMQKVHNGTLDICGRPYFITIGLRKPHAPFFIPEKYFSSNYCLDYFQYPLDLPFNDPATTYPPNGIIMPPQPDTIYNDYLNLPATGLAQFSATSDSLYYSIYHEIDKLDSLPFVMDGLTETERREVMHRVISANAVMGYMAAIKFLDTQIGRLIDSLEAYPESYQNTIIILASDNGFSLGEKRHWKKGAMWETDLRVPFIVIDLREPIATQVQTTVSLLDIFPTLCAMTGVPEPLFADGSTYLDGRNLLPLIHDAAIRWEKPALSAFKHPPGEQLSCTPEFSVRNDRFHYMLLTSNSSDWELSCHPEESYTEQALYEHGIHRNVDPNEWHNLAYDPDFLPVIQYLQQWFPDSALYLQKTYRAAIDTSSKPCQYGATDTIHLAFTLYDPEGIEITAPEELQFYWSNNIQDTVYAGISLDFSLDQLTTDEFDAHDRIIWYLHGYDSVGVTRAFDIQYYYLTTQQVPEVYFSIEQSGVQTIQVTDVSITGDYQHVWWDFGDGTTVNTLHPGPHTYPAPGSYIVSCFAQYGNNATCVSSSALEWSATKDISPVIGLHVYPNPTSDRVWISAEISMNNCVLQVVDLSGKIVQQQHIYQDNLTPVQISFGGLPAGLYKVCVINDAWMLQTSVVHYAGK